MNSTKIIPVLLVLFFSASNVLAQVAAPKPPRPATATVDTIEPATADTQKSFWDISKTQVGLMVAPSLPVAGVSDQLGFSTAGFNLFGDLLYPKSLLEAVGLNQGKFNLYHRYGLGIGFASYSSPDTFAREGNSTQLSFVPYTSVFYPIKLSGLGELAPFFKLGFGLTSNSISVMDGSTEVAADSSIDGTLLIGLGAGFQLQNLKMVTFYFETSYRAAFETVSGHFLAFALGASYKL